MSRLLLKARPTPAQLADRLQPPLPDGLELYLDAADLADNAAIDRAVGNLGAAQLPRGFALLIEGPVRSLDGEFFDLTRAAEADREVVRRLARFARRVGALAVNVHVIAPTAEPNDLSQARRAAGLDHALDLIRFFVDAIAEVGAVPTIENMPPILRMRESGFYYSAIGMPAEDLVWLCERVPGLRATLDLSHAGLYLNCRRLATGGNGVRTESGACLQLLDFVRTLPAVDTVEAYAERLGSTLLTCHVANARGLLGEGQPYGSGDLALDQLIPRLAPRTAYFVTETLEPDPDQAVGMRQALAAMRRAIWACVGA